MSPAICWRTKASQSEKGLWPGGLPGLFFCPREHGAPMAANGPAQPPKGAKEITAPRRKPGETERPPGPPPPASASSHHTRAANPHRRRHPVAPLPMCSGCSVTYVFGSYRARLTGLCSFQARSRASWLGQPLYGWYPKRGPRPSLSSARFSGLPMKDHHEGSPGQPPDSDGRGVRTGSKEFNLYVISILAGREQSRTANCEAVPESPGKPRKALN